MATNETYIKDGEEIKRQKCLIYTRVMGYMASVSRYNPGKKSEFYSRKSFLEGLQCNRDFITKYANELKAA